MLENNRGSRRLLKAAAFALAVPAVVTCGGRGFPPLDDDTGGSGSVITEVGGGSSTGDTQAWSGTGGALGCTGGAPHSGAGGHISYGGSSAVSTGGATVTSTWEPTVFLGKYLEPVTDANYRVPAPPATSCVTRPCNEHTDVCAGVKSRDDWAKDVVTQCMAETGSAGCIDFIFDNGASCAQHAVIWHGATFDMGRCVSTVAYYESCSTTTNPTVSDAGSGVYVARYGADCSPL